MSKWGWCYANTGTDFCKKWAMYFNKTSNYIDTNGIVSFFCLEVWEIHPSIGVEGHLFKAMVGETLKFYFCTPPIVRC